MSETKELTSKFADPLSRFLDNSPKTRIESINVPFGFSLNGSDFGDGEVYTQMIRNDPDWGQIVLQVERADNSRRGNSEIIAFYDQDDKPISGAGLVVNGRVWVRHEGVFNSGPTMDLYVLDNRGKWYRNSAKSEDPRKGKVSRDEVWNFKFHDNDKVIDEEEVARLNSLMV